MAARSPHSLVVRRLLLAQLAMAVLFPLVLLPFGTIAAKSAALGGIACLVPSLAFAYRAFRFSGARSARKILSSFYSGEALKLVLTALIFALIFINVKTLNVAALFGGFILVQSVIWATILLAGLTKNSDFI